MLGAMSKQQRCRQDVVIFLIVIIVKIKLIVTMQIIIIIIRMIIKMTIMVTCGRRNGSDEAESDEVLVGDQD